MEHRAGLTDIWGQRATGCAALKSMTQTEALNVDLERVSVSVVAPPGFEPTEILLIMIWFKVRDLPR